MCFSISKSRLISRGREKFLLKGSHTPNGCLLLACKLPQHYRSVQRHSVIIFRHDSLQDICSIRPLLTYLLCELQQQERGPWGHGILRSGYGHFQQCSAYQLSVNNDPVQLRATPGKWPRGSKTSTFFKHKYLGTEILEFRNGTTLGL